MGQVHSQLFSSNATEKQLSNSERGIIWWEEEWMVSVFIKIVVPLWCGNETLKVAIKQADKGQISTVQRSSSWHFDHLLIYSYIYFTHFKLNRNEREGYHYRIKDIYYKSQKSCQFLARNITHLSKTRDIRKAIENIAKSYCIAWLNIDPKNHQHSLVNFCLPKTVFSDIFTESSFQCFIPKSSGLNTKIDFPITRGCPYQGYPPTARLDHNTRISMPWAFCQSERQRTLSNPSC